MFMPEEAALVQIFGEKSGLEFFWLTRVFSEYGFQDRSVISVDKYLIRKSGTAQLTAFQKGYFSNHTCDFVALVNLRRTISA